MSTRDEAAELNDHERALAEMASTDHDTIEAQAQRAASLPRCKTCFAREAEHHSIEVEQIVRPYCDQYAATGDSGGPPLLSPDDFRKKMASYLASPPVQK